MFINAIKKAGYVKPFSSAYKTPYNDEVIRSMFSVILINDEGWVLTTKGVLANIIEADKIHKRYEKIKEELILNTVPPKKIYKKYKVLKDEPVILKNVFLNTISRWSGMELFGHEYLDLALVKFENPEEILCDKYPVFGSNPSQGEMVCRLGYPYPELEVLKYNHASKDIELNNMLMINPQVFPIEGMVTRTLLDEKGNPTLFEVSNGACVGHIGGAVINKKGELIGMQIGTAYKDTGIDINSKIKRNNKEIDISEHSLIPLSICVNIEAIKEFLDKYKIEY